MPNPILDNESPVASKMSPSIGWYWCHAAERGRDDGSYTRKSVEGWTEVTQDGLSWTTFKLHGLTADDTLMH